MKYHKKIYNALRKKILVLIKKRHASRVLNKYGEMAPREGEVIWIDPCSVSGHMSPTVWNALKKKTGFNGGTIVSGKWDITDVEYLDFTSEDPFVSCYDHWINGKCWQQTSLFVENPPRLIRGETRSRRLTLDELKTRYEKLDKIYHSIESKGEMSTEKKDLVKISIARDGTLIWGPDGRHRLCIAICIGIVKIPALTGFVHAEAVDVFQTLRNT